METKLSIRLKTLRKITHLSTDEIYQCNISYLIAENDVEFKKVNSYEMTILRLYRSDFLFRSTISQLIRFIDKTKG